MNAIPAIGRRALRLSAAVLAAAALLAPPPARADEAGSGHYFPGYFGYFGGILPTDRGVYFANYQNQYVGAAGGNVRLEIGGQVRAGVLAYAFAEVPSFTYMTGKKILGGNLGMNLSPSAMYLDASAAGSVGPLVRVVEQTNFNLGDLYFAPVVIGWNQGNLHEALYLGFFAPTGEWKRGELAPTGKNYWTFESDFGFTYLNPKSGWEASGVAGIDFNARNQKIDYTSGDDFHLDVVLAKHVIRGIITPQIQKALEDAGKLAAAVQSGQLPPRPPAPAEPGKGEEKGEAKPPAAPPAPRIVLEDVAPGLGFYCYQQVTGDSGRAALLGPFEGRAFGLGPQILATASFGKTPVTFQLKVLKEFQVQNRLEGINTWFTGSLKF